MLLILRFEMKYFIAVLWSLLLSVTAVHAQSNYRVSSGDTLSIEVLEDPQLSREVLVVPGGTISFPFVGTVRAAGRTVEQIRASIVNGIASNFAAEPTVFVSVSALRELDDTEVEPVTMNVYFLGEVTTPGLREVEPGTTFLQGMSQAGGFTPFAATKRIQLRRTNRKTGAQTTSVINYRALSRGAGLSRSIRLQEGDVILVPGRRLFE